MSPYGVFIDHPIPHVWLMIATRTETKYFLILGSDASDSTDTTRLGSAGKIVTTGPKKRNSFADSRERAIVRPDFATRDFEDGSELV